MSKFIECCKEKLKNKSIDYKLKFAKLLFNRKNISSQQGEELLEYIFDIRNSQKGDREISQEEIDLLFSLLYENEIEKNIDKIVEYYIKYGAKEEAYKNECDMIDLMEIKHNKWLSDRIGERNDKLFRL